MKRKSLLSIKETAQYFNVSEKTIRRLIKDSKLEASRVGRLWRIKKEDADKFIEGAKNV